MKEAAHVHSGIVINKEINSNFIREQEQMLQRTVSCLKASSNYRLDVIFRCVSGWMTFRLRIKCWHNKSSHTAHSLHWESVQWKSVSFKIENEFSRFNEPVIKIYLRVPVHSYARFKYLLNNAWHMEYERFIFPFFFSLKCIFMLCSRVLHGSTNSKALPPTTIQNDSEEITIQTQSK